MKKNVESKVKKPFYKRWWFIAFFVVPFGFTLLGQVLAMVDSQGSDAEIEAETEIAATVENELLQNIDVNNDELLVIEQALEDVDITDVESVEYDEMLEGNFTYTDEDGWGTEDGYRLDSEFARNILLYIQDGKLLGIEYGSEHMLYKDGEAVDSILNYVVTTAEFVNYTSQAEEAVKQRLKSPSTAKFPGRVWAKEEWNVFKRDGHIYVESYVDAENSFGATSRDYFQLIGDIEANRFVKLTIGDTVYE